MTELSLSLSLSFSYLLMPDSSLSLEFLCIRFQFLLFHTISNDVPLHPGGLIKSGTGRALQGAGEHRRAAPPRPPGYCIAGGPFFPSSVRMFQLSDYCPHENESLKGPSVELFFVSGPHSHINDSMRALGLFSHILRDPGIHVHG